MHMFGSCSICVRIVLYISVLSLYDAHIRESSLVLATDILLANMGSPVDLPDVERIHINERITNKLRKHIGQYGHTSDNYRTC